MSCKLRIEYPVAMYHVMSRGDQREDFSCEPVKLDSRCLLNVNRA